MKTGHEANIEAPEELYSHIKEVKMEAEQEKKINKKIGKTNYENRTYCNVCK